MVPSVAYYIVPAVFVLYGIRKWRERQWGICKNTTKLNNKIVIVTGANSGIGYQVVKELALRDATVILACRSIDAAKLAIERIKQETGRKDLQLVAMELDLASLNSVKNFANNVQQQYPQIDILINNAGVAYPNNKRELTKDGFEIHFGVNHLGHFYLTQLLEDGLKKPTPSRIIIVSSTMHERGAIRDDIEKIRENNKTNPYHDSKLANVYFGRELSKRLQTTNANVYIVCPGWVYTNLFRHSIKWHHYILGAPFAFLFMRNSRQGAQTIIHCATEAALKSESGLIYRDCNKYQSKVGFDETVSDQLWSKSVKLIESKTV